MRGPHSWLGWDLFTRYTGDEWRWIVALICKERTKSQKVQLCRGLLLFARLYLVLLHSPNIGAFLPAFPDELVFHRCLVCVPVFWHRGPLKLCKGFRKEVIADLKWGRPHTLPYCNMDSDRLQTYIQRGMAIRYRSHPFVRNCWLIEIENRKKTINVRF